MSPNETKKSRWGINPLTVKWIAVGILVAVVVLAILPMIAATQPAFFSRFHSLAKSSTTLAASTHQDIPCASCHVPARGQVRYQLAVSAEFYAGLLSRNAPTRFLKFDRPTRDACRSCHITDRSDDIKRTSRIPHPAHMRVASETRDCVTCHKWTAHQPTVMVKHKKMPFSGVCVSYGCHVGTKKSTDCFTCHHALGETAVQWKVDHPAVVQRVGANGCIETCHTAAQCTMCHTTGKTPVFTARPMQTSLKAIEVLHTKKTWMKQHGAEALKDRPKCLLCHVSDAQCQECHTTRPDFHGSTDTWIGGHSKLGENEARCLECHKKQYCEDCHKQFKEMR